MLGASWDGRTTRFTLSSSHATAVELCLFDQPDHGSETRRLALDRVAEDRWGLEVADAGPGTLYGYRVHGPWAPQRGHRFNPSKLLVDPYARAITGAPRLAPSLYTYRPGDDPHRSYSGEDSAAAMPKGVVVDPSFDWQDDRPPHTPWRETVIYECHVKGLTRRHRQVPERLRGTYLGLVAPPVLDHLRALGITAVELLPVHQFASEPALLERGLTNFWGYNPLGFFAPHAGYATGVRGVQVSEFKTMVRELHRAGLEVILDLVLNHTAEGNHAGPTLSWKGIDNRGYYRLDRRDPRRYVDYTGCGNTLDVRSPAVLDLALSCLRYWVSEMHVDGFRFDLAPVLGRDGQGFDAGARFFAALDADPTLSRVKLIAEPWDLGPGGYRLGDFPSPWREWNGRYRDAVRRFWRGDPGADAELRLRLAGSEDLFAARAPLASINYVTSHDGFTLADLVTYEHKRNLANLEDNRDGPSNNLSRNWGHEGPSDDPDVRCRRLRTRRNLLATLAFSRGVPMILAGDEIGRSQQGNNNAYCHDSALSWLDWAPLLETPGDADLTGFLRRALEIRRRHPELRDASSRLVWLDTGDPVVAAHWLDAGLLLLLNPGPEPASFTLPESGAGCWRVLLDTARFETPPAPDAAVESFALRLLRICENTDP